MLARKGHKVLTFQRNSHDIKGLWGKMCAFTEGIYSRSARKELSAILASENPDIVHVHNLYPLISPSVLVACREFGVPVVMRCPNYRLICPVGVFFDGARICERCSHSREYWCVLKNCRGNVFESVAYALRNVVARKRRFFQDNVTLYLPPSEFVRTRLVDAGFPRERIIVVPNMVSLPDFGVGVSSGEYVAYVGRISPEKGIETLLAAAEQAGLPLRLAGDYFAMPEAVEAAPLNAQFIGQLNQDQLVGFHQNARFCVVPSICFDVSPHVVAEAMSYGLAVIASRIGGLPEIVEDGVTGFLFEPGNAQELAEKMKLLWENPELCRKMGKAGREKAIREYSEDVYYDRLIAVYRKAIQLKSRDIA
jgi:glycosyltransferase involved in cell wall biosynthesis